MGDIWKEQEEGFMKFYFAPMEGITLYPLRNIHHEMFGGSIDKYYTPFLTAHHNFHFKKREKRDAQPEYAVGFENYEEQIVPQIMANRPDTFLWAAREMKKLGYKEVNINLGCPAATVTNSHKGAGLLTDTEYLDKMLGDIFMEYDKDVQSASNADARTLPDISIKTRLGFTDEKEADSLMRIYAKYPVKELTIHARVREDFYKGQPRIDAFKRAAEVYRNEGGKADICYNGNIFSADDLAGLDTTIKSENISSVMLGRGLLTDPALARVLSGGDALKSEELREYLKRLYEEYAEFIPEERNVIFKMLEHWAFLYVHFEDCERNLKLIRKARSKGEYFAAVNAIFHDCKFS